MYLVTHRYQVLIRRDHERVLDLVVVVFFGGGGFRGGRRRDCGGGGDWEGDGAADGGYVEF
jgi:hypothetical protein